MLNLHFVSAAFPAGARLLKFVVKNVCSSTLVPYLCICLDLTCDSGWPAIYGTQ